MNTAKLGELNGWWALMFKVRQVTGVILVPVVIAVVGYLAVPWGTRVELRLDLFGRDIHALELRLQSLEEFARDEPGLHRKDDDALETKIMLGIAGQNQVLLEKLTVKIDALSDAVNSMRVDLATQKRSE